MRSGERPAVEGRSRQRAPRPASAASAVGGRNDRSLGPFQFGPGYSPWKDPTVVVLLLISLVALVLFVGGATFGPALSDDGGDGVFPVIDILAGDDGGGGPALSLAANRTELTIGDAVAFTVTGENGTPAAGATVAVGGATHEVDDEGRVVVRIDRPGSLTARASAPGAEEMSLESDEVGLSVAPRRVDLAVQANRTSATVGEPIALTLVRADIETALRGEIVAAEVPDGASFASEEVWRDAERIDGARLVVVPDRSGRLLVRGTRADQGGETYSRYVGAIEVERRVVALDLTVDANATTAGESVGATVRRTDTGEPVAATLSIGGPDGSRTVETGPDGTAQLTFEAAGTRTIEATAESTRSIRFAPDSAAVAVERRQVGLAVAVDRPSITTGGRVTASVTRAETGEPVDATVEIAGETHATGDDGTVETTVEAVDEHAVVATASNTSAETFVPAETALTVADATIELGDLDAPASAAPGETVTLATTATNQGPEDGADTVELVLGSEDGGDEVVDHAVVEIPAGAEARAEFDVAVPEEPGTYEVAIRGSDGAAAGTIDVDS